MLDGTGLVADDLYVLDPARSFDPRLAVLAGLAEACGLGFRITRARAPGTRTAGQAGRLLDPELGYLIGQVQAASGCAVLAHRT